MRIGGGSCQKDALAEAATGNIMAMTMDWVIEAVGPLMIMMVRVIMPMVMVMMRGLVVQTIVQGRQQGDCRQHAESD